MQVAGPAVLPGAQFEALALAAARLDALGFVGLGLQELPARFAAGEGQTLQRVALRLVDQRFPLLECARRVAKGVDDVERRMGVLDGRAHHLDAGAETVELRSEVVTPRLLDAVPLAGQHVVERVAGEHGAERALGARLDEDCRVGGGEGEGRGVGDAIVDAGRDFDQVLVPGQHQALEGRRVVEPGVTDVPLVARPGAGFGGCGRARRADRGHSQALRLDPRHPIHGPGQTPVQARAELAADVASEALHEADFLRIDHPQAARRPDG